MTATSRPTGGSVSADEAFLARMQAQCEEIEAYRLDVLRREDRKISLDQAAREWIARYADGFAEGEERH